VLRDVRPPRRAARVLLAITLVCAFGGFGSSVLHGTRVARAQETTIYSLSALAARAGDDPRATYARIRIPSLGVDAPVSSHRVEADASAMPNPYGPADAGWYDFEETYFGGAPGAGRNAVFSGHVNYNANVGYAGVRYAGPGVFAEINRLRPGDIIEVERNGKTYRYAVSWQRIVDDQASTAWTSVVAGGTSIDSITLFTCDGTFDPATRSYSHRTVVRAERLEGNANRFAAPLGGTFSVGVSGTTHPEALIAAQRWPVTAIYAMHPTSGQWLVYRHGAPAFANTLLGYLRQDSFVIIQFG
jgi:sortase (surface protein transpeptidase)